VIPGAIVGAVCAIVGEYTRDTRSLIDGDDMRECVDEFLDLIRRVSDTKSKDFLNETRLKIRAAIRLSVNARYHGVSIEQRRRQTPTGQALSFVTEVADYYHDYKKQSAVMDTADVLASDVDPVEACSLCLLHPGGLPPLGMQALRRLLPRAHFCAVS